MARAMGIRDRPTAPRSPWQNGYCERLIGSIRGECLDHMVVFGERHLRHLLRAYADYYNRTRTHLSLPAKTPHAMRASLLASAMARTLRCSLFLAASIQCLSPCRSQLIVLISTTHAACTNRTRK